MSDLKEYVVTASSYEVLDDLCNDMESPGGSLYIPNRAVEVANLRPQSRNTHYYLTDEEAEFLRKDPRVLAVERLPEDLGIIPIPDYIQTETTWNKSASNVSTHKNWGLLRVFEGQQRPFWGSNGTASVTGTIDINLEGRDVDVVIVDGLFDPTHPEFTLNSNGTGPSRVVQYNWYELNPEVTGGAASNYVYGPYTGTSAEGNNNHGAHVAGTVAGNTQGWARQSAIYNIYPYSNNPSPTILFDYLRIFHRRKPINPVTGLRRPTIVNNSWGYGGVIEITAISNVNYRGTLYNGPFTSSQLNNFGIFVDSQSRARLSLRNTAVDADLLDATKEGLIIIGSAGNNYSKVDVPGGVDYDNYVVIGGFAYFYNRGGSPGAAIGSICVGAMGSTFQETKATFSNCGPRVDIYAPGSNIMSSLNSIVTYGGTTDPRNPSYFIGKISGTSMSGPQVAGLLACVSELYPNLTPDQALNYIQSYAKVGQITNTGGGPTDYTDLQGSENRYLTYVKERPNEGAVYPKSNYKARPTQGVAYPRTRILRYGR